MSKFSLGFIAMMFNLSLLVANGGFGYVEESRMKRLVALDSEAFGIVSQCVIVTLGISYYLVELDYGSVRIYAAFFVLKFIFAARWLWWHFLSGRHTGWLQHQFLLLQAEGPAAALALTPEQVLMIYGPGDALFGVLFLLRYLKRSGNRNMKVRIE